MLSLPLGGIVDARVSHPKPGGIQLAEEKEFRLGAATVDPVTHEVRFGGAIERIHEERSVSELFDGHHENSQK